MPDTRDIRDRIWHDPHSRAHEVVFDYCLTSSTTRKVPESTMRKAIDRLNAPVVRVVAHMITQVEDQLREELGE